MFDSVPFVVMQSGVPIYLSGPAGSGKTTSIELVAKRLNRKCYCAIVHQGDPIEVTGLPYIDVKAGVMKYTPPEWVKVANAEPSIIFFDEASGLDESYQLRMLTILSHRRVGAYSIPDHTWFVLAGNPIESGTSASLFSIPFITRLCCFDWQPDDNLWMNHMLTADMSFDVEIPDIPVLPNNWTNYLPETGSYINAFLKTSRNFVSFSEKELKGLTNSPVPTRRSWDLARRAFAAVKAVNMASQENIFRVVSGCVGRPAAGAFCEYISKLDLPDSKELIQNAARGMEVLKRFRLDQIYIIVSSACIAVDLNDPVERRGIFNIINELYNNGQAEFSALMIHLLTKREPQLELPPELVSRLMPLASKIRAAKGN